MCLGYIFLHDVCSCVPIGSQNEVVCDMCIRGLVLHLSREPHMPVVLLLAYWSVHCCMLIQCVLWWRLRACQGGGVGNSGV